MQKKTSIIRKTALIVSFSLILAGCIAETTIGTATQPISTSLRAVITPAWAPAPTSTGPKEYLTALPMETQPVLPEFTSLEVEAARAVVMEYFHAVEAKDEGALLKTMTAKYADPNMIHFCNEQRKLLTIDYNSQDKFRSDYVQCGSGSINGSLIENVIVFKVSFDVKYPSGEEPAGPFDEGVYDDWSVILIRADASQGWLIDGQGY